MINIQPNGGDMNLTADQFTTILGLTMQEGLGTEYEVVEHDHDPGIVWLWVHHKTGHPTRHWVDVDGELLLSEVAYWQPTYEDAAAEAAEEAARDSDRAVHPTD